MKLARLKIHLKLSAMKSDVDIFINVKLKHLIIECGVISVFSGVLIIGVILHQIANYLIYKDVLIKAWIP